jgi:hypothetical protein
VIFEAGRHLIKIEGFQGCLSLLRMGIPASVEFIRLMTFSECSGPKEVIFEAGSPLGDIDGFQSRTSLIRLESPASVVGCFPGNEVPMFLVFYSQTLTSCGC